MTKRIKVIHEKKWKTETALENAVRRYLDRHPDSDQLDICNAMRIDLRRACELLDRLVAEGKVRIST